MRRELKLLVLSLVLLGLNSCRGHLPESPKTDFCIHSIEDKGFVCIKPDETVYVLTYDEAPNYIAQSPKDAEIVNQYILSLEKEVSECRSKP